DTKEFPDKRISELNLSLGYNTRTTLRNASQFPLHGLDYLGFDSGDRREMPANIPATPDSPNSERFAESLPNVWTPSATRVLPDASAGLSLGGRLGGSGSFGYASAVTYNRRTDSYPDRFSQLVFDETNGVPNKGYLADETTSRVDIGAIVN